MAVTNGHVRIVGVGQRSAFKHDKVDISILQYLQGVLTDRADSFAPKLFPYSRRPQNSLDIRLQFDLVTGCRLGEHGQQPAGLLRPNEALRAPVLLLPSCPGASPLSSPNRLARSAAVCWAVGKMTAIMSAMADFTSAQEISSTPGMGGSRASRSLMSS